MSRPPRSLTAEALRSGTIAGLAMIPFAAAFRARGLRINEYGRKTLALLVGETSPGVHYALSFLQHLLLSWVVAVPFLWATRGVGGRTRRVSAGLLYGAGFYLLINAWALPAAFGDPPPWELGLASIYPSLWVHLVYGGLLGFLTQQDATSVPGHGA